MDLTAQKIVAYGIILFRRIAYPVLKFNGFMLIS